MLLGIAIAIATTLAVRMVGVRAPFLQRSEVGGQAVNTAKLDAPKGKPSGVGDAVKSGGEAIDVAPTASIAQPPAKPDALDLAPADRAFCGRAHGGDPARDFCSPCATRPPLASPMRNTNSRCACSKAGDCRRISQRRPGGSNAPPRSALPRRNIGLGRCTRRESASPRDPAAAKRWYLKAAEAGNARAAHNLAVMSAEPGEGAPNYAEAVKWFRRAAELGVRDSQYNLAILYARGLGVEKDLGQSWFWFVACRSARRRGRREKRDEIAREMDPAALASAAEAFMKFKAVKPDPAANEVAAPPGGWDAKTGSSSLGQSPPPAAATHPQAPL